ncbi:MAG: hypothetical protein K9G49_07475 [Taibaiella sp.]|nr:hypothetical protein [Taibaiella sp.]
MKLNQILAACLLLFVASCNQSDKFTGVWSKDRNPEFDAAAFPSWNTKGKYLLDTGKAGSPLFIRIKKELNYYVMNCYQFDAPKNAIVADPSIFDYVKFTKEDEFTLMSDNKASNITIEKQIVIQLNPVTGILTMNFHADNLAIPTEKKTRALFHTMFNSGYHKIMEVRRKTEDANLIDTKLKEEHVILNP